MYLNIIFLKHKNLIRPFKYLPHSLEGYELKFNDKFPEAVTG